MKYTNGEKNNLANVKRIIWLIGSLIGTLIQTASSVEVKNLSISKVSHHNGKIIHLKTIYVINKLYLIVSPDDEYRHDSELANDNLIHHYEMVL